MAVSPAEHIVGSRSCGWGNAIRQDTLHISALKMNGSITKLWVCICSYPRLQNLSLKLCISTWVPMLNIFCSSIFDLGWEGDQPVRYALRLHGGKHYWLKKVGSDDVVLNNMVISNYCGTRHYQCSRVGPYYIKEHVYWNMSEQISGPGIRPTKLGNRYGAFDDRCKRIISAVFFIVVSFSISVPLEWYYLNLFDPSHVLRPTFSMVI